MTRPSRPAENDDTLTHIGLGALGGVVALAGILRVAVWICCLLEGTADPGTGLEGALGLVTTPLDPSAAYNARVSTALYWTVVGVLLVATTAIAFGVWRLLRSLSQPDARRRRGVASRAEIAESASARALRRRGGTLRPSLRRPRPEQVGYRIGRSRGLGVWVSVEDSILLLGPPRSGKGWQIVINTILDAPGAVITTSTRPDNLTTTLTSRQELGPVAVFDPQQLAAGLSAGMRWSPVRGCEDPLTAMIRARGLASSTGFARVDSGDFWEGKARVAIQGLLHAAALDGRTAAHLQTWALNPAAAQDAARILHAHPRAASGWADALDSMLHADPRTRDSIWQGVALAFASLADPRVLAAVTPADADAFDPAQFLRDRGTLYLIATGAGTGAAAPLVAAFIEDLVETARRMAAASPGARLDPPVLLALDEIGNLAPLPSLPTLMAEGGGTGITTLPVLQSLAQARDKWGEHQAAAIWDAAIVKILLGGSSSSRDLQDIAALIGDHQPARTAARGDRGEPILPANVLRTLPIGTAAVLLRTAPPIVADLLPWTARPDAAALRRHRDHLETVIHHAATA